MDPFALLPSWMQFNGFLSNLSLVHLQTSRACLSYPSNLSSKPNSLTKGYIIVVNYPQKDTSLNTRCNLYYIAYHIALFLAVKSPRLPPTSLYVIIVMKWQEKCGSCGRTYVLHVWNPMLYLQHHRLPNTWGWPQSTTRNPHKYFEISREIHFH